MASPLSSIKRIVVVGGGISGLSTAFSIIEEAKKINKQVRCTIVESQPVFGGKIQTMRSDSLIIEGGPDSFLTTKPWALDLCEKLGLTSKLINTNQENNQTFAYSKGRLREIPQGLISMVPTQLSPLLRSGLLSWPAILRMAADLFIPPRSASEEEETLGRFFGRRLGQKAFDRLIEPLVAGIYAGDAYQLSVEATFPQFVEIEQKYGSLIKGALAQQKHLRNTFVKSSAGRTLFTTLQGGLGDLVEKLVEFLKNQGVNLITGEKVLSIASSNKVTSEKIYRVKLEGDEMLEADGVVLATPAYVSAPLLYPLNVEVSTLLNQIPYASTVTISMRFLKEEVKTKLHGFGFVIPRIEAKNLIAATWSSLKWAGRAKDNESLIRCYLGGSGREIVMSLDDKELIQCALGELREMVGIVGQPIHSELYRWERAMPQYTLGHMERVKRIRLGISSLAGLYLTGAAYRGIGIPDCIRDAGETAKNLSSYLWKKGS